MIIDNNNPKHITAEDGMVLVRMVGYPLCKKDVILGNVVIDGVEQPDSVDNYIEVAPPPHLPCSFYAAKIRKEARV